jgi:hypothetical protein
MGAADLPRVGVCLSSFAVIAQVKTMHMFLHRVKQVLPTVLKPLLRCALACLTHLSPPIHNGGPVGEFVSMQHYSMCNVCCCLPPCAHMSPSYCRG